MSLDLSDDRACTACCFDDHVRCDGWARVYHVGGSIDLFFCKCPCNESEVA